LSRSFSSRSLTLWDRASAASSDILKSQRPDRSTVSSPYKSL
jgi:hypothetical protein